MPWQLIYTSAPRGLLSGQSGFCTVARSAELREALAPRLEQISSYHYLRVSEAATANRNPTVSAFRVLDLRGAKYYVLTRIQPCGLDFTARTNHLAHHVVFQPDELAALPSPAAILRHWPGWLSSWQGEPRWLEEIDTPAFASAAKVFLPAQTWARVTGDGGRAAGLLESECVRGCYLLCPAGSEEQVLEMYCETLQLLNFNGQFPLRPWRHTFTAFLQAEDNPNDFQWRGCQEDTPAYKQALTRSAPMIPLQSVRVPANSLVKLARAEPKPQSETVRPSSSGSTAVLTLRRDLTGRKTSERPSPIGLPLKQPIAAKRTFLDINFSVTTASIARVGIFAAVLAALLWVKFHLAGRAAEQGSPAQVAQPTTSAPEVAPPPAASPRKTPVMAEADGDARQLVCLTGEGPTYVLAVPNLSHFNLPIDSVSRFRRLLTDFDELRTRPAEMQLTVNTDRWDFPPGAKMTVGEWMSSPRLLSASAPGLSCEFDYSGGLKGREASLDVRSKLDKASKAFSIYFGFSSNNDDPFRLLIVNEKNAPAPLRGGQHSPASTNDALRLLPDFHLLPGKQWALQPLIKPESQPAQFLYWDWPANEVPAPRLELDFAAVRRQLKAERGEWKEKLDRLRLFLARPLGEFLGSTNAKVASFLAFSRGDLSGRRFVEYLKELRKVAPDGSWIKKWSDKFDSDQMEDPSEKFQKLYELWSSRPPPEKPNLTEKTKNGETNYFMAAWQVLKETQSVQDQMDRVQRRLDEVDHAYVALCIVDAVDPKQPRPGLEMIRFGP